MIRITRGIHPDELLPLVALVVENVESLPAARLLVEAIITIRDRRQLMLDQELLMLLTELGRRLLKVHERPSEENQVAARTIRDAIQTHLVLSRDN